jgi:hypothetical protein
MRRAASTARLAYQERGLIGASRFVVRTATRKTGLLLRHLLTSRQAARMRVAVRQSRQAAPAGSPHIAVAVTGGVGDFLVIARFLRDLAAQDGGAQFDLYCPRPAIAQWACAGVPGFNAAHHDVLFDTLRGEYDLALRANQMVTLYPGTLRHTALRQAPRLAEAAERLIRIHPQIAGFVEQHPWLDHRLAETAVTQGRDRRDYLHHLAGIDYGGDALEVPADPAAPGRFGLYPGRYVTVHNGFDTDFVVTGTRATKCYPHFGRVVEQLRAARPDLVFVQLGTVTSEPIAACDHNLIGQTSMAEAAGLLAGALLHLDNEGGLVHLAACLGTRSAVVFGPTSSRYFGYPGNINIDPPVCGGCWWTNRSWMDHCPKGYAEPRCVTEQDPLVVAHRVLTGLEAGAAAKRGMGVAAGPVPDHATAEAG